MKAHHIRNSNTPRGKINPSIDPVLINSLPKRPISSTDFKSIGHQWTSEPSLQLHGFCCCWYSVTKNSAFSNSADVPPEKSTCFQVNTMSITKRSKWLNVTNNQNYRSIEIARLWWLRWAFLLSGNAGEETQLAIGFHFHVEYVAIVVVTSGADIFSPSRKRGGRYGATFFHGFSEHK